MEQASAHDGCDHSIRIHLDGMLDSDWLATCSCLIAFPLTDDPVPIGFLYAYDDKEVFDKFDQTRIPCKTITAIVHPTNRRQGVFRCMISHLRHSLSATGNEPRFVYEFSQQSSSGLACAKALALQPLHADACDLYMQLTVLSPPVRELPRIKLVKGMTEHIDEILPIWLAQHPESTEEKERADLCKDLQSGLQYFIMRTPEQEATIGSATFTVGEKDTYVMNVIVKPEARGKGYGEAMMREVVRHLLEELRTPMVALETTNQVAARMYQRVGFKVVYSWGKWVARVSP